MDLENILIDKKEIGKLVGLAKRSFTIAKTRTVKVVVDSIEDYENEYFVDDTELARLVKAKQVLDEEIKQQKKELDTQIIERINDALKSKRGYDAEELYDKRQGVLLGLLKEAHEIIDLIPNPRVDIADDVVEGLSERLGNMIKDLEGAE